MKQCKDWHEQLEELSKKLNFAGADIMEEIDAEILKEIHPCDTDK